MTKTEPGFTIRPAPEIRQLVKDISDRTGVSVAAIYTEALVRLLDDDTAPIMQLYRFKRGDNG